MAAKAKLLLRELKTVKADLAFAKERCAQLEEENKILRESRDKGDNPEDDDLVIFVLHTKVVFFCLLYVIIFCFILQDVLRMCHYAHSYMHKHHSSLVTYFIYLPMHFCMQWFHAL